jgi:hypothetical protein
MLFKFNYILKIQFSKELLFSTQEISGNKHFHQHVFVHTTKVNNSNL